MKFYHIDANCQGVIADLMKGAIDIDRARSNDLNADKIRKAMTAADLYEQKGYREMATMQLVLGEQGTFHGEYLEDIKLYEATGRELAALDALDKAISYFLQKENFATLSEPLQAELKGGYRKLINSLETNNGIDILGRVGFTKPDKKTFNAKGLPDCMSLVGQDRPSGDLHNELLYVAFRQSINFRREAIKAKEGGVAMFPGLGMQLSNLADHILVDMVRNDVEHPKSPPTARIIITNDRRIAMHIGPEHMSRRSQQDDTKESGSLLEKLKKQIEPTWGDLSQPRSYAMTPDDFIKVMRQVSGYLQLQEEFLNEKRVPLTGQQVRIFTANKVAIKALSSMKKNVMDVAPEDMHPLAQSLIGIGGRHVG